MFPWQIIDEMLRQFVANYDLTAPTPILRRCDTVYAPYHPPNAAQLNLIFEIPGRGNYSLSRVYSTEGMNVSYTPRNMDVWDYIDTEVEDGLRRRLSRALDRHCRETMETAALFDAQEFLRQHETTFTLESLRRAIEAVDPVGSLMDDVDRLRAAPDYRNDYMAYAREMAVRSQDDRVDAVGYWRTYWPRPHEREHGRLSAIADYYGANPPNKEKIERDAAEQTARTFLFEYLSDEQRECLKKHYYFKVHGNNTGNQYAITVGRIFNIKTLDKTIGNDDRITGEICLSFSENLPMGDLLLMQKISLESDEMESLAIANRKNFIFSQHHKLHGSDDLGIAKDYAKHVWRC